MAGRRADGIRFEVDNDRIEFIDIEDNTRNENVFIPTLELDTSHGVGTRDIILPPDFMNYKEIHAYTTLTATTLTQIIIDTEFLDRIGSGGGEVSVSINGIGISWTEDIRRLRLDVSATTWTVFKLRT